MRTAVALKLTEDEASGLQRTARSSRASVREVLRARIVLLAAAGRQNRAIAAALGVNVNTVKLWRDRFAESRLEGLQDQSGRGRKRVYGPARIETIVDTTLTTKPKQATHWSTRTLAQELGVSHMTIHRVWRAHHLQPHRVRTFKLSTDKHFVEKLRDVVGLYLNPPEHAFVLCVDEKSQIQALDRTQPGLPLKRGRCGTMTHDYKRHGTTTLFAALNMLDGTVIGTCMKRHRHLEYLRFLRQLDQETPAELELHLIVDNYATHKHDSVKKWLARHPRFHMHFIPTSASWLNMVERFFGLLTERRLRRGVFRSVPELIDAVDDYLKHNNEHPQPFVWTQTADAILEKLSPLYNMAEITLSNSVTQH